MLIMYKFTKQQQILFNVIGDDLLDLGEISQKYFNLNKSNNRIVYAMKRNSRMASWLNQLHDKGYIDISYCFKYPKYSINKNIKNFI